MFSLQRLGQKRAELHAQEQQLARERGSLTQQFEAESNALYEATKHVCCHANAIVDDDDDDTAAAAAAAGHLLIIRVSCEVSHTLRM
jgi:hypothetical protein